MQAEMLELSRYRIEKAQECLADSQVAFDEGRLATMRCFRGRKGDRDLSFAS